MVLWHEERVSDNAIFPTIENARSENYFPISELNCPFQHLPSVEGIWLHIEQLRYYRRSE
ncbi:hypothetical protein Hdeb2414_s0040g00736071 [Helianthus debilis subsp. tardiflorus]